MVLNVLLIDTCCELGFVALMQGEEILFCRALLGRAGAQELIPMLAQQLASAALSLQMVDLIGVTIGPGSYTGIRLGVISAQTLAYALDIPLVGVPSLSIYAPPRHFLGAFAALMDARMGGVYLAINSYSGTSVNATKPLVCTLEELPGHLAEHTTTVVTPHRQQLQQRMQVLGIGTAWSWYDSAPEPLLLLQAVLEAYHKGDSSRQAAVSILYLRRTQAELESETKDSLFLL